MKRYMTVSLRGLLTELSPQLVAVPGWTCVRGAAGYFAGLRKQGWGLARA